MKSQDLPLGTRVTAGKHGTQDFDCGTVAPAPDHAPAWGRDEPTVVWVDWVSGTSTWCPVSEIRLMADLIREMWSAVDEGLPRGFEADWTVTFQGVDREYNTTGPDWALEIPVHERDARLDAVAYSADAEASIREAVQHEEAAGVAIDRGDYEAAADAIRAAAACEASWGDAVSYQFTLDRLRAIEDLEEAFEDM